MKPKACLPRCSFWIFTEFPIIRVIVPRRLRSRLEAREESKNPESGGSLEDWATLNWITKPGSVSNLRLLQQAGKHVYLGGKLKLER